MSFIEQPFVSFSEKELVAIFWQSSTLKSELQRLARPSFPELTANENPSQGDVVRIWLTNKAPGFLIKRFLSDIAKEGLTSRKRGKAGYKGKTRLMSVEEMRQHLGSIREVDFKPLDYETRGYAMRGSIRTDGFRLQLLAFKLRELNMVKYRRLPENHLPPRISTTIGGLDYYLTEIRNVVKTPQDVTRLWPDCRPEDIKVLALDGGQVCVVGAYAYLPKVVVTKVPDEQGPQMDVDVSEVDHDNVIIEELCDTTTSALVLAPTPATPTEPAPE
ncbi:hypothetical protein BGZ58_005712, partial [Dissophora ornata]